MDKTREDFQHSIAMMLALISWGMLFATLFLSYALYRASQPVWPPAGMSPVPLPLPALSTLVIALSSFTYQKFAQSPAQSLAKKFYISTLALAGLFVLLQFLFWRELKTLGIYASSGIFGSLIYGFTWIHMAHIVLGLAGLCWVGHRIKKGVESGRDSVHLVRNVGKFWHFLGIIWGMIFVSLFVF